MSFIERLATFNVNKKETRRVFLRELAAGLAATVLLEGDRLNEGRQLGGEWISPENHALVDSEITIQAKAYHTEGYDSQVKEVWFTLDPSKLSINPLDNPKISEEQKAWIREKPGRWLVIKKCPVNDTGIYSTDINFLDYGAEPGSPQTISFDVHGLNQDGTPAENDAPQGKHEITIKPQASTINIPVFA